MILGNFGLGALTESRAEIEPAALLKTMRIDQTDQVFFTYANEMTDLFAFGLNAKYVMANTERHTATGMIDQGEGKGFAVDLGAMFKVGKIVRVGAVLKDFGLVGFKLNGVDYEWPTRLVLGGAVKAPLLGTVVAADLETPLQGDEGPRLPGSEWNSLSWVSWPFGQADTRKTVILTLRPVAVSSSVRLRWT